MFELIATLVITAGSLLLFAYWFRYTCVLILETKTSRDFAGDVVIANRLSFPVVQQQLKLASPNLAGLHESLDRDYSLLTYLVGHSGGRQGDINLEARMLKLNYQVMGAFYRVSRPFSTSVARKALEEMSMVVAYFANVMGERAMEGAAA